MRLDKRRSRQRFMAFSDMGTWRRCVRNLFGVYAFLSWAVSYKFVSERTIIVSHRANKRFVILMSVHRLFAGFFSTKRFIVCLRTYWMIRGHRFASVGGYVVILGC